MIIFLEDGSVFQFDLFSMQVNMLIELQQTIDTITIDNNLSNLFYKTDYSIIKYSIETKSKLSFELKSDTALRSIFLKEDLNKIFFFFDDEIKIFLSQELFFEHNIKLLNNPLNIQITQDNFVIILFEGGALEIINCYNYKDNSNLNIENMCDTKILLFLKQNFIYAIDKKGITINEIL